MSYEG